MAAVHPHRTRTADHREVGIEAELLSSIAEGDSEAFHELWNRYRAAVYRTSFAICREQATAEDAVQETFMRIWRRASTFDPTRGHPTSWILTIARNTAKTVAQRRPLVLEVVEEASDDETEDHVDRVWIQEAMQSLSPKERTAIELAYFSDMSHSQIAAHLGEPLGTIKARIRRALMHMADVVEAS